MSKRTSKSGGKYGGRHTSMIELAALVCKTLENSDAVQKISPGIITTQVTNLSGKTRIKIIEQKANVLLRVRDNGALQEVRVYGMLDQIILLTDQFCVKNNVGLVYS